MIYNLPNSGMLFFLHIFNFILRNGTVPVQWRTIKVLPKRKPGRDPNLSSLRPISLLCCPCKIFHLILMKRTEQHIESNKLLSQATLGFRRSRSCLDNVPKLVTQIEIGFQKNQPTLAYFLDIDSAYNTDPRLRNCQVLELLEKSIDIYGTFV